MIYIKKNTSLVNNFLSKGYVIFDVENLSTLKYIKNLVLEKTFQILKKRKINYLTSDIFNNFHKYIHANELNDVRMEIYSKINSDKKILIKYASLAQKKLDILCGNEIAIQRKINLSIQLSGDNSSLLPIHSDVWSGCSPYEIVLWVPLVNVQGSKSMFIFPKPLNDKIYKAFKRYSDSQKLFEKHKQKVKFLKLKYGQGLIFMHSIMHGNIVNNTKESRWSLNCRIKSLMSPYYKKSIGETFVPLGIKPVTKFGMEYEHPEI